MNKNDEKQQPNKTPLIAFFVTWRIKQKNRNKDYVAMFDDHRDAAEYIVKNKKQKPDIQVYMAIREILKP